MKFLRTLSTGRLLALVLALAALAAGGAAIAVAASGGSGQTPPAKPLAQAIHDALGAQAPPGITADISFTNKLFPSGSLLGSTGSALMSGATGRLWATNDGRGRLELQSAAGDVQIVWNMTQVTAYDASSNTVYKFSLPAHTDSSATGSRAAPTLTEITDFLTKLADRASLSEAHPSNVGGQPAYSVSVSPKHDGGLLGSVQLAWDAIQGVPLRIGVYAQGSSTPVIQLEATNISYGSVAGSDVNVTPPAGAKTVDLGAPTGTTGAGDAGSGAQVSGLAAVQAAASFPVTAPDTLVGLPRQDVRLVGSGSKTALAVYGQGLGAIVVVERPADAVGAKSGALSSLPTVALDGVSAHELATQLGTVIEWQRGGVDFVLAGSLPPAGAETAARELK
ncbi:MAG: outer membrane lipoprotein carrier protein LolA [Gaiellaceae bacterium]